MERGELMELALFWILCAVFCAWRADRKGRSVIGWGLAGFCGGPLTVLLQLMVLADTRDNDEVRLENRELRRCPSCAEEVQQRARKCRYCGEKLTPIRKSVESDKMAEQLELSRKMKY